MARARWSTGWLVVALALLPWNAAGRVTAESRYTKAQNYSAALRFLRVDKGFEVVERDENAAYLIFRYPVPERKEQTVTGTIEVVELDDTVTLIVKLPQMPEYHERLLSDQLVRKLRDEYGAPSARKPKPPEKKKKSKTKTDEESETPAPPTDKG